MITPEDALETLDKAAYYLQLFGLGKHVAHPVQDIRTRIEFMRDQLWESMVKYDAALGDAMWAWLREPS